MTPAGAVFIPPKGFVAPDSAANGGKFDLVCTFEPLPDGKLKLVKLGDMEISDGALTHKPDYSEYSKSMMESMPSDESEE